MLISHYAIPGLKNKKGILKKIKKNFSAEDIERCVCEYFKLSKDKFISTSQKREFIYPRQVFMYLCLKYTMLRLDLIGNTFPSKKAKSGRMDRHTVLYARGTIQSLLDVDERVINDVKCITDMITEGFGSRTIKDLFYGKP